MAVRKRRGIFERPRGSGVWWIRYTDQNRKEHREKVGIKSAALSIYQQRKTEIRLGRFEPEDIKKKHTHVLLSELLDDRLKRSASLKSSRNEDLHCRHWRELWGDRPAKSITVEEIEEAREELLEDHAPATVKLYLSTLNRTFNIAVKITRKVEVNPVQQIRMPKEDNARVRYLTDEEETRLKAVVTDPLDWILILVALHTGLRKMEQFRLKWADIDLKIGQLTVTKSKSGKPRVLPINQTLMEALRRIPVTLSCPYLFPGKKPGTHRTDLPRGWDDRGSSWLRQAGIEDFTWHSLRHTFASRLVMNGVDLYTVSKLLGHADIKMTMRYAHLAPEYLKSAVQTLDSGTATSLESGSA